MADQNTNRDTSGTGAGAPLGGVLNVPLAELQAAFPALASKERGLQRTELSEKAREAIPLWIAINLHTDQIGFRNFRHFVDRVLVSGNAPVGSEPDFSEQLKQFQAAHHLPSVNAYQLLKQAAEAFLVLRSGVWQTDLAGGAVGRTTLPVDLADPRTGVDRQGDWVIDPAFVREGDDAADLTLKELGEKLAAYLAVDRNNYVGTIVSALAPGGKVDGSPYSAMYLDASGPFLIELIWSYWMEEAMLAQAVSAILLRFQNVRRQSGPDPLAELELDPLRPLGGFLWGYLQDEPNRLSVKRRAYEYNHHYGLTIQGRAIPDFRPADPRARFLQGFHNLLRECALFYREDNDTTVIADAFGVLNALKEVHLILAEGAHNQFRDLPWTARVEMLLQQWLLARPEMREFLRGRAMVPYPEEWMGRLDAMNKLQGWTDASVLHFHDLAAYGERILLSIRYGNWTGTGDQDYARAWARYWREEVQGYIHAYQTVTGVGLTEPGGGPQRYAQPSLLLRRRRKERAAAASST